MARTCPKCGGAGEVITDPCLTCKGQGRVEKTATLKVTIPAGVDRGARMRLSGEGESGRGGGPTGDLYVVLDVEEHPRFTRDGAHVRSDEAIPVPVAILGGEVELETLHGKQTLEIPPGTQAGREFRCAGRVSRVSTVEAWVTTWRQSASRCRTPRSSTRKAPRSSADGRRSRAPRCANRKAFWAR